MLLKSLTTLAAAATVFSAPTPVQSDGSNDKYTLSLHPDSGSVGMKPLQIRGEHIFFGLEQGFSYFRVEAVGDNYLNVESKGQPPKELYVADGGELMIKEDRSPKGKGLNGGWNIRGDGPVKELSLNGTQEFYSCASQSDPQHGGQVVYIKKGDYGCQNPFKFTIGATNAQSADYEASNR